MCTRKWQWISYFQQFVIIGSFCTNRRTLNNTVKIVCLFWKVCPIADYIMLTWNTRIPCLLIVCVQSGNFSFSLGTPVSAWELQFQPGNSSFSLGTPVSAWELQSQPGNSSFSLELQFQPRNSSFSLGTPVSVEIPVSGREFPHRKVQVLVPVSCETARNHMASTWLTYRKSIRKFLIS